MEDDSSVALNLWNQIKGGLLVHNILILFRHDMLFRPVLEEVEQAVAVQLQPLGHLKIKTRVSLRKRLRQCSCLFINQVFCCQSYTTLYDRNLQL